jgi:hypothetical protein
MDETCTHTRHFVRGDRCTHTAAAKRNSALNLSSGDRPGQRNNKIRIVIQRIELACAEVSDFVFRS